MKNTPRDIERFWQKTFKRENGCWEHPWDVNTMGYGRHWNCAANSDRKRYLAHRYSWMITHGDLPTTVRVCHKCDNTLCVNPEHLFLGTDSDNQIDRVMKWRHNTRKLTVEDVLEIRKRRTAGEFLHTIAKDFGVHLGTVHDIATRKTWKTI